MNKGALLLAAAVLVAVVSSLAYYQVRSLSAGDPWEDELGWLRHEFSLTDNQWEKVVDLHVAYRPECQRLCDKVSAAQLRLDQAIAASDGVSEDVELALAELARIKKECHRSMLEHAYRVGAVMEPEQRQRYLDKVTAQLTVHGRDQH